MARARTLTEVIAAISQKLQDTSNAVWTAAELKKYIQDALVEVAEYVPYEVKVTLTTTASKELSVSTIEDLLRISRLEYLVDQTDRDFRNWEWLNDNTIRMDLEAIPSAGASVYLYCEKAHHLDPDWTVATAFVIGDYVAPTTKNGYRYKCTVAGTSHASTQPTWPTTAEATVADNTVTWTCKAELPNTLETPSKHIEDLFIDLVTARALINKGALHINEINVGSKNALQEYLALGQARLVDVQHGLRKRTKPRMTRLYPTA